MISPHISIALLVLVFAGVAFAQDREANMTQVVEFCDLMADPAKYDGKTVKVRATWRYGFEWDELYCRGCRELGKTWRTVAELDKENQKLKYKIKEEPKKREKKSEAGPKPEEK